MNFYMKYTANVYLAKCGQKYEKGDKIMVTTKYGKENECIVFNLILEREGVYYYSIVRADGFNAQEYAKRKMERLSLSADIATAKSDDFWIKSQEGRDFLSLGEPIKIGHHSENRHRALIERNHNRMSKAVEQTKVAATYQQRADYWANRMDIINLSMPESIEYYEFQVEGAQKLYENLKNNKEQRSHSYSLTYAKKDLNNAKKNLELAKKLWS